MGQEASWEILCSLQNHNAFIETATCNNIFGSYYHVREPQTQKLSMTFGEYAHCAKQWTSKKLIFKVTHCWHHIQSHIKTVLGVHDFAS